MAATRRARTRSTFNTSNSQPEALAPSLPSPDSPMDTHDPFPFERTLSLVPLIEFWREVAEEDGSARADLARTILTRLEEAPELLRPLEDFSPLEKHRELLDLMMSAVFPMALSEKSYAAAFVPFKLASFYATPALTRLRLIERMKEDIIEGPPERQSEMMTTRALKAYHYILREHYGVGLDLDYPMIVTTTDERTGLKKHYNIAIDTRFTTIERRGPLKALAPEVLQRLLNEPTNLALWMDTLPPEQFAFHGFVIMTAVDVTAQQVLSRLKDDLLQRNALTSSDRIETLQMRLRMLMQAPDLQLGLICLQKDDFDAITGAYPIGQSLLLKDDGAPYCPHKHDSYYARAFIAEDPIVVNDLEDCQVCTGFEKRLLDQNLRNLVLAPLRFEGELVGLLELASPTPGAVNALNAVMLKEVVSLFATAMKRSLTEREDRVQALIKKQYTAIHPTVEWRFREAALRYIEQLENTGHAELEQIVFHEVYPLYGLSDIRNSSTFRNEAIRADLLEQLGMALSIIIKASTHQPLPALDEIGFRLGKYIEELVSNLDSGGENTILEFLREDVEPLFDRLGEIAPGVREKVQVYRDALDPALGIHYRQRKDFEDSVTLINETISAFIDEKEEQAQEMFPHYFEKYKTDGVDYNLYIGASLVEKRSFDRLYLRNIRLWQLMTMCGVVWEMNRLKPKLKTPLDTAHLILVQDIPLSIRFRQDEKKFDVDGAYNIRYEIVKKRIDKARVRGREERLTQPGKIAIVYSQTREAEEYLRYIEYLQAGGYLQDDLEELELEDLQGVYGLHALRVSVAPEEPSLHLNVVPAPYGLSLESSGDGAASVEA